ncbi:bifunctional folylpolyglutamate synthase/dihydrofolate synthase [Mucilaginibacter sp. SMC90]|uniref:bifunctional folylpolyglutamate synthase/dihydrofolate synthase n=1 Tax=Mucilaginibacter sp. SMC90 TaxID=2929803 RepID=UPI001FB4294A|nr:folylpolyglutamate synthase/dihydrofolate synthase family protein [Mucilaginibacter sp. SMC90]UOE47303.1 bifunctional folylpolyglutamate synthase/dihydrofolate synthase [Mucilaginibacter sp. SMC90]
MNYNETIQYLYTQLPMFTRDGASAFKKDLTNTLELCRRLDNPQHKFKSVHTGGTNGKGSTSHMLAAILQTAGYKTGLYTSPHLKDFRERIRINGQMISEQTVIDFVEDHKTDFEEIAPSFFEMTVALAFDVFAKEKVDIAIIEVGLGGRLDSTNVITPLLSVITNIGWDHMNMLGNTLPLIAGEKAGIIKPGVPVIIGEKQDEVAKVFIDKASETHSKIWFASEEWIVEKVKGERQKVKGGADELLEIHIQNKGFEFKTYDLALDLPGTYQLKNVKTVLSAVDELQKQDFIISDDHIQTALKQVKILTGLHGRWETLSHDPLTICDTGHNPDGIEEVMKNIAAVKYNHLHMVIGMVNDKDTGKVLPMFPKDATYYFCKPDIPRGLDAEIMKTQAEAHGLICEAFPSVKEALLSAQKNAGSNDLVFVGGSTFVVAEVV